IRLELAVREAHEVHRGQSKYATGGDLFRLANADEFGGGNARVVAASIAAGAEQVMHGVTVPGQARRRTRHPEIWIVRVGRHHEVSDHASSIRVGTKELRRLVRSSTRGTPALPGHCPIRRYGAHRMARG